MSKKRLVNTKFWSDNYTVDLDPIEKLLFLYLLTNEKTSICGIYELPLKIMAVETGVEKEMIDRILKRFEKDGKVKFENGWVAIRNFIKHQTINPSIEKGIRIGLNNAPKELKEWIKIKTETVWGQSGDSLDTARGQTPSNLNPNSNLNTNTNTLMSAKADEREKPFNKKDIELTDLLFNLIKGNFSFVKRNPDDKDYIEMNKIARLDKRDYKLIKIIICWCQQDEFWKQNIRSVSKLRKQFESLMVKAKSQIEKFNNSKIKNI